MKTLQLVPAMEQGGVERGVVEMNRAIVAAGWQNVVVSAGGRLASVIEKDGGRHLEIDVKSKNPLTYFSRAARLRKALVAERPDVVCAHSRVPAWLFRHAARGLGIPWITFAHGANSVSPYSRIMTAGDLTVTPSRFVAEYLKDAYGIPEEKLRVIPRASERERFDTTKLDNAFIAAKKSEWGVSGETKVAMAAGRITQLKGFDILVKAAALLPRASLVLLMHLKTAEGSPSHLFQFATLVCPRVRLLSSAVFLSAGCHFFQMLRMLAVQSEGDPLPPPV